MQWNAMSTNFLNGKGSKDIQFQHQDIACTDRETLIVTGW